MEINAALASQFYENLQSALAANGAGPTAAQNPDPDSPAAALRDAARSFVDTLREAEQTSLDAMAGKADPQSVVTALAGAELAVQNAVMIRDKVVESYQEILRMPV